jgi:alkaline phosphatase D
MLSPARLVACLLGLALLPLTLAAQGELLIGPMLGYQTHREVAITLTTRDAAEVRLDYWISDRPETRRSLTHVDPWVSPAGGQPQQFVLPVLEMGATYDYAIIIDGEPAERAYPLTFRTQDQWEWRGPPPAFSFLFGSCAYINDPPYDRPGRPYGAGTTIFRHMADSGAEFMIWAGDNLYLRESDWSSASGIWYRFQKDFSHPDLQPLFARMPHYATWDDHDFGPNNSNRAYELKHVTLAAFTTHFANRTWGEPDNPGVYGKFQYGDAAFFLLDNRYHRDESEIDQDRHADKSMYGRRQVEWLLNNLAAMHEGNNRRHSPIRFIVTGGQFTSDRTYPGAEGNHRYARERAEILDFIRHHRIPGVIFLSGDVHYTELVRRDDLLDYPLYELTSSPLAAGAHSRPLGDDPYRIAGTAVQTQNYCRIALSGPADDRVVTITCHGADGALLWTHAIRVNDLQIP